MYKIHFEDRFIVISSEPDRLQKYGLFHKFNDTREFYKLISDFQEDKTLQSINVYGTDITHLWRIFRIYFTEVSAAGGLVRHVSGRYLFLERRGKVDLPKGHVEPGEKPEACAMREVEEECGITGHSIVKPLIPSYHTYILKGISYLKRTDWFLMKYDGELINKPQISEGITSVMWLYPDEISKIKNRAWLSLIDLINTSVLKADQNS